MKIQFFTPAYGVSKDAFSGATFGFVGQENEYQPAAIAWPDDIEGTVIHGSYQECLDRLPNRNWKAGIVLLGNAGNENEFIRALSEKTQVPLIGGGAAINPETGEKGLISGRGQAAVLLLNDDHYDFMFEYENIHYDILGIHRIGFSDPRVLNTIDGMNASKWLRDQKLRLGLAQNDFEHLTLSDTMNVNVHLSEYDGCIHSGRDLCANMLLRYVAPDCVQDRVQRFYQDDSAIVFGCAGLKGILDRPLTTGGMGLFMFGEVCALPQGNAFGNLMLSQMRILRHEAV